MTFKILSFYEKLRKIKSFPDIPSTWQLVNPYRQHWDRFEFFYQKYYNDENRRDLIIALNPGRFWCNKTGIALTDENVLFNKLKYPYPKPTPEMEGTATKIYSIIEELHPNFDTFFSKFFMTNIFPFGVVADRKNVLFDQIIKVPSINNFCKNFITKSIEIFKPEIIFCVGRGSEKFIQKISPVKNQYTYVIQHIPFQKKKRKNIVYILNKFSRFASCSGGIASLIETNFSPKNYSSDEVFPHFVWKKSLTARIRYT